MLQSCLFCETVQYTDKDHFLVLNSASDPFIARIARRASVKKIVLAEDNVALPGPLLQLSAQVSHVPFHTYTLQHEAGTIDTAVMNLLYQPGKSWMLYGLQVAAFALKRGGRLYVEGAKDRGIMTIAKHMRELFGNVETLEISKGRRVLCSVRNDLPDLTTLSMEPLHAFADSQLDDGTRLLLPHLAVQETDIALDMGCGAGFIGLHLARQARLGHVTMVDTSLTAVDASLLAVKQANLDNVRVVASNGVQAVRDQQYDLIATNPPFHQGGIQTREIAEQFIRDAAQVLQPTGHFYLVANRFLKYEPTLRECFQNMEEIGGDTRYKVLCASIPVSQQKMS
ncbi:MAG TPA: class I SAM-dependent methyltransferase [Dictyobacter sp.]|jgi:16S rRNA (guanine1207-N2)-methyltransferase|nr:class I SAM-dependent methyltransferase [Dictyobacter sp.]